MPLVFPKKDNGRFSIVGQANFEKIPESPIGYWVSNSMRDLFVDGQLLREIADSKKGLATTDNNRFLRLWFEVTNNNLGVGYKTKLMQKPQINKWFPLNKGGSFRKWYGNKEFVINWFDDAKRLQNV